MTGQEEKDIYTSIGTLNGLMTGVRDDVAIIKKKVDKAIPGTLLITIISTIFAAVFMWLGVLTSIMMKV